MPLILKPDLDIVKMYHHTKNEICMSTASKAIYSPNRQTDRLTHTHTHTIQYNINSCMSVNYSQNMERPLVHCCILFKIIFLQIQFFRTNENNQVWPKLSKSVVLSAVWTTLAIYLTTWYYLSTGNFCKASMIHVLDHISLWFGFRFTRNSHPPPPTSTFEHKKQRFSIA